MIQINGKTVDIQSVEVEGIDMGDYPDFCDAFISFAEFDDGKPLSDAELDILNEDRDFVYSKTIDKVF